MQCVYLHRKGIKYNSYQIKVQVLNKSKKVLFKDYFSGVGI